MGLFREQVERETLEGVCVCVCVWRGDSPLEFF